MGEEGFSSDSSLLYHRNIPSTDRRRREWDVGDLVDDAEPPAACRRHLKLHDLFEPRRTSGDSTS